MIYIHDGFSASKDFLEGKCGTTKISEKRQEHTGTLQDTKKNNVQHTFSNPVAFSKTFSPMIKYI